MPKIVNIRNINEIQIEHSNVSMNDKIFVINQSEKQLIISKILMDYTRNDVNPYM